MRHGRFYQRLSVVKVDFVTSCNRPLTNTHTSLYHSCLLFWLYLEPDTSSAQVLGTKTEFQASGLSGPTTLARLS